MPSLKNKVKVSPTLIDSYFMFRNTDYITLDEMIDRVNRVKRPTPPAAAKGIAYNDLIDALIQGENVNRETVKKKGEPFEVYRWRHKGGELDEPVTFDFGVRLADRLADRLQGAETQVYSKADIETPQASVQLHGYADYVLQDSVIDLKTTGRYTWPKYLNSFQYKVYLYTLRQSGIDVKRAEYLVTDFNNVFIEDYYWNDRYVREIIGGVSQFLIFVDEYRDRVTNENFLL